MNEIEFSVITVCLNPGDLLLKTAQSVLNQTLGNYEYIIKDGFSTDGSIDYIPDNNKIVVIKRKDSGIYDAMNQAISAARGKYICFMDAGDMFVDYNVLYKVSQFTNNEECIYYGNYIGNGELCSITNRLSEIFFYRTFLCHQAVFVPKKLFNRLGCYDGDTYKLLADHDFHLRAYNYGIEFIHVNFPICIYLGDGVSEKQNDEHKVEVKRIRKKYYSKYKRILFSILLFCTFPAFRKLINSNWMPRFIRKMYRFMVNSMRR